jgi:hypothetical protein
MPLLSKPAVYAFALSLLACVLLPGCASKKPEPQPQPQPQTIHLRGDASVANPGPADQRLTKSLFNIVISPKAMTVNGTPVKNLAELERLLTQHQRPALTLAAHKCLSTEKAAEVMSLAQRHTDTPIAFGSYGRLDDPECK